MRSEVGPYGPLLDALRGVAWPARRHARGAVAGTHRSPLRGISPEFTEYRSYRQGDDPRRLDWKLLARTDRASVRVTRESSTLATLIALDASASMAFPQPAFDKWEQACRVAIGLAAVALAAGDPVGFVVATASGARSTMPRARRSVLEEGARLFANIEPGGSEPLLPALRSVPAARGVRLAIISDFLGDADDLIALARERASAGGDVYAVHIVAGEELEPGDAAVLATDPEAEEIRRPLAASTRTEYQRAFALWRGELARSWRTAGAAYTEVLTNETAARAVRRVTGAGSEAGVPARSAER
ncbi:MAG TPA: DUF58 domain-containing protein [Gemmatimonadaceae bacterium]|jgi:uncharacterized protein (DUF58 family)|nr:DUF58 domain-containing protein [Gemmatimonadaceae bacterium]